MEPVIFHLNAIVSLAGRVLCAIRPFANLVATQIMESAGMQE